MQATGTKMKAHRHSKQSYFFHLMQRGEALDYSWTADGWGNGSHCWGEASLCLSSDGSTQELKGKQHWAHDSVNKGSLGKSKQYNTSGQIQLSTEKNNQHKGFWLSHFKKRLQDRQCTYPFPYICTCPYSSVLPCLSPNDTKELQKLFHALIYS